MSTPEKAVETQLNNIQTKTGKTLAQLSAIVKKSGLTKHGEIRAMLQKDLGLSYGDANALVHHALQSDGMSAAKAAGATTDDVLDGIYTGPKASLRPIHEKLMTAIQKFGEFEIAPKKGYVSLRRKKQFAMVGPTTNTRVEVGLNMKDATAGDRLVAQPKGSMCNFVVKLTDAKDVDKALIEWIQRAYEQSA